MAVMTAGAAAVASPMAPPANPTAGRRGRGRSSRSPNSNLSDGIKPRRSVLARAEREQWDFGRFVKTVTTFNPPPTPGEVIAAVATGPLKIIKTLADPEAEASPELQPVSLVAGRRAKSSGQREVVMVAGATTEAGRAVLQCLLSDGKQVRALVSNSQRCAGQFSNMKVAPGGSLELAAWDGDASRRREVFRGVGALVCCTVGGQEISGLLKSAEPALGLTDGKDLFNPEQGAGSMQWAPLDDVVMGGCSVSKLEVGQAPVPEPCRAGIFSGTVSTANSGGFGSVRTLNLEPPLDLSAYQGLRLRVFGDGQRYKFILRTDTNWDTITYCQSFDTTPDEWQEVSLPFQSFIPVFRAKTVRDGAALDTASIISMQLMLSKFEYDGDLNPSFRAGEFMLPIASVAAFMPDPLPPRLVVLAGPQVQEASEAVRASGLPAVVVEVSEVVDHPAPRPELKVKRDTAATASAPISCPDAAHLSASLLHTPEALGQTLVAVDSSPQGSGPSQEEWMDAIREML